MSIRFPGTENLLRGRLLARLEEAGRQGAASEDLRRSADGDGGPELVEATLARLEREGLAIEQGGRWIAASRVPREVGEVGVVELLEKGDAIVRSAAGEGDGDGWFVRRKHLKGALDGDRVLVKPLPGSRGTGTRRDWRLAEAAVVKVLGSPRQALVGQLEADEQGRRWLVPFDRKLDVELQVVGGDEVGAGEYVVVEIERSGPGRRPRGRMVEVLGPVDRPSVDVAVVLRHHGIPEEFPPEVLQRAAAFPADPTPADWAGRLDLRDRVVVTIDGETARDFDDAISVESLGEGAFRVGVHIADVSHYVKEGDPLDLEAYRRGTSVYYPERAVPMLPEGLSNGLCSLRPQVPRLTVSVFLDIGRDGFVRGRRLAETVIRSARRLTYREVRRLLEGPRPGDEAEYGPVLALLRDARAAMEAMLAARLRRGSIDFDLPEGSVELATDGTMVGVLPSERTIAHRIVEEMMIAANEAVAFELASTRTSTLYRVHDAPSPERLEELADVLASVGLPLRLPEGLPEEAGFIDLHPSALQDVLSRAQGHPEEELVSALVLRTMQRAVYSPECRGHYALASAYYAHFTSPIRRYPDLVAHRRLKALLAGRAAEEAARTLLDARLAPMGEHSSATERRAEQSERDLLQWKKVRFMAGRVGETFRGRISGVQPFGLFVHLDGYHVDGLVPIRTMTDDYYVHEPEAHRLVGERNGRVFKLADAVDVVLVGADERHRGLDFVLAGMPATPAVAEPDEGPRRGRRR